MYRLYNIRTARHPKGYRRDRPYTVGSWKDQGREQEIHCKKWVLHKFNLMTQRENTSIIGLKERYKLEVSSRAKHRRINACKYRSMVDHPMGKLQSVIANARLSLILTKRFNRSHTFRCKHIILRTGMKGSTKPK
jgi:hypothetical protein